MAKDIILFVCFQHLAASYCISHFTKNCMRIVMVLLLQLLLYVCVLRLAHNRIEFERNASFVDPCCVSFVFFSLTHSFSFLCDPISTRQYHSFFFKYFLLFMAFFIPYHSDVTFHFSFFFLSLLLSSCCFPSLNFNI